MITITPQIVIRNTSSEMFSNGLYWRMFCERILRKNWVYIWVVSPSMRENTIDMYHSNQHKNTSPISLVYFSLTLLKFIYEFMQFSGH